MVGPMKLESSLVPGCGTFGLAGADDVLQNESLTRPSVDEEEPHWMFQRFVAGLASQWQSHDGSFCVPSCCVQAMSGPLPGNISQCTWGFFRWLG
eukprot:6440066-Amphidinium_carterae.1